MIYQLHKIVGNMRPTQSAGLDTISIKILKESFEIFAHPILNIVNTSIETGLFPNSLKTSKVIPVIKRLKDPQLPASYRPINLLEAISKILEKVVLVQLADYMEVNDLIPHHHHGGRHGHGTATALITMFDTWTKLLEDGKDTAILVIDQSAAYDVNVHQILKDKLAILGFDHLTLTWFRN
jgi:hypothetical protein